MKESGPCLGDQIHWLSAASAPPDPHAKQPEGALTSQRASPEQTAGQRSSTACTHPSTPQLSAWCSWGDRECPRGVCMHTQQHHLARGPHDPVTALLHWGSARPHPTQPPKGPLLQDTGQTLPQKVTPEKLCQKWNFCSSKRKRRRGLGEESPHTTYARVARNQEERGRAGGGHLASLCTQAPSPGAPPFCRAKAGVPALGRTAGHIQRPRARYMCQEPSN